MPDPLPADALTAAQEAITRVLAEDWHDTWLESDEALARAALEAAAPALRAQGAAAERARIRQLAIDRDAIWLQCEDTACDCRDHGGESFADLLDGDGD